MTSNLLRNIHALAMAEWSAARAQLRAAVRRLVLLLLAATVALFGFAMANAAGYCALFPVVGMPWAFAIVAGVDFLVAAMLVLAARGGAGRSKLGSALGQRRTARAAVQADVHDLLAQIRGARETVIRLVRDPLEASGRKLVTLAFKALVGSLRAKKTGGGVRSATDPHGG